MRTKDRLWLVLVLLTLLVVVELAGFDVRNKMPPTPVKIQLTLGRLHAWSLPYSRALHG